MRNSKRSVIAAVAGVAACCLSPVSKAQNSIALAAHSNVAIVHVKPDMLNEWIDLEKNEVIPALKKGGIKTRTTYQTVRGNVFEYVIVTPFDTWGQFDGESPQIKALGAQGSARLGAKLRRCEESVQTFVSTPLQDLSNLPNAELGTIGVFTRVRVSNGKLMEYENFIKNEILPYYKKANARYQVSRRGLGANSNDIVSVSFANKFADLDAGSVLTRALGADGVVKLLAKSAGLGTLVEQVVRRQAPDLSF
ncbi:MAG TPA: hypothetical protein VMH81_11995 [Bryobacteraceae bacterium]|nr:hypothetical protein [Bryobacteraceae bacterium]